MKGIMGKGVGGARCFYLIRQLAQTLEDLRLVTVPYLGSDVRAVDPLSFYNSTGFSSFFPKIS